LVRTVRQIVELEASPVNETPEAPAVLRVQIQCRYCHKYRPAEELLGIARMCLYCREWHAHALEVLSGAVPKGCQECGLSFEQIRVSTFDADVKMYVVPLDGIYQVLCRPCCGEFVRKSRDRYQGTAFAERMNLR
jgi:hypothetical protein